MLSVLSQDGVHASRMCDGLRQLFSVSQGSLKICSAYITPGGISLLESIAEQEIGGASWNRLPKEIVTCLDFGITTPDALRQLLGLKNCTAFVVNAEVVDRPKFRPVVAFHPKAYCVHTEDHGRLLCGSANLTRRGLTLNAEMGVLTDDAATVREFVAAFSSIDGQSQLNEQLILRYESIRGVQSSEPEDEPIPPSTVPGELPAFSDFISGIGNGALPQRFWIEAGTMTSSGSRHQLELPRRGNRYFGCLYNRYDGEQRDIDTVSLLRGQNRWDGRRIVWHGDNGMERLYLPTQAEGGVSYVNTAVLFERLDAEPHAFSLTVVPWGSEIARSWVNASIASNLIFRVPQNPRLNARMCGLLP